MKTARERHIPYTENIPQTPQLNGTLQRKYEQLPIMSKAELDTFFCPSNQEGTNSNNTSEVSLYRRDLLYFLAALGFHHVPDVISEIINQTYIKCLEKMETAAYETVSSGLVYSILYANAMNYYRMQKRMPVLLSRLM